MSDGELVMVVKAVCGIGDVSVDQMSRSVCSLMVRWGCDEIAKGDEVVAPGGFDNAKAAARAKRIHNRIRNFAIQNCDFEQQNDDFILHMYTTWRWAETGSEQSRTYSEHF